jgi:DNA-binding transcriptional ArsR family regulator
MTVDQQLYVAVDWAPAYELVLSLSCLAMFSKHRLLELGEAWAHEVRQRFQRQTAASVLNTKEDRLLLPLVRVCPGPRDATSFIDWLKHLSAGGAYEALAPKLREAGPGLKLPRDFAGWRDRVANALHVWNDAYFQTVDAAILDGLRQNAAALQARAGKQPAQTLIEEMTNGILVEPGETQMLVTLVPQYHERPYNEDFQEQGGVVILYPADVIPPPPGQPPSELLRLTHALGDESRLRMLRFVADGPCTLTEVARFIGLSQPTVHHHLVQLRAAGLVRVHFPVSGPSRYSLRPHALDQLNVQLGRYLQAAAFSKERSSP